MRPAGWVDVPHHGTHRLVNIAAIMWFESAPPKYGLTQQPDTIIAMVDGSTFTASITRDRLLEVMALAEMGLQP